MRPGSSTPPPPQVLEEARNAAKLRQLAPPAKLKEAGYDPRDKRDVLTVEDLVKAMGEVRAAVAAATTLAGLCSSLARLGWLRA